MNYHAKKERKKESWWLVHNVTQCWKLTLLNTVLLGTLVVFILLLAGDALDALVVVVLVRSALSGVCAL